MTAQQLFMQIVLPAAALFLLLGSLLGVAVGIGLIVRHQRMLRFMHAMNRWVSVPGAVNALDAPLPMPAASARGRWLGAVLIVVGAYSAAVLVGSVEAQRAAALFGLSPGSPLAGILLESAKWLLVLGSLAGIATGIMLVLFPGAWRGIETKANRWYSTRELAAAGDTPYPALDRLVEAFPKASGSVILVLSLAATLSSVILLIRSA